MRRIVLAAALAAALFSPTLANARGGGGGHGGGGHGSVSAGHGHASHSSVSGGHGHASSYCGSCSRDSNGHIARSGTAKREFMASTGHPRSRPGYVVDHIVPLKRGGADTPANMQWQMKADARDKDKWE
jgi:hypothetical protein